jgi:hypothetical protein
MQFYWICMRCSITLYQFAKRTQITCDAVAKGNRLPFRPLCLRKPRIACNAENVSNIPLGELNFKYITRRQDKKILLVSAIHIHIWAYQTITIFSANEVFLIPSSSVVDPDLYVSGPSGSSFVIILYGSRSLHQQAKKVWKTLISTILWLFFDNLSLKNWKPL